jgi:hypothetical protein
MRYLRAAGVAAALAALCVPAIASAHPSAYTDTASILDRNNTPGVYDPVPQIRHVVSNHGFTYVFRETNSDGAGEVPAFDDGFGVVSYSRLPGDHPDRGQVEALDAGDTGAQAHYTCWDATADGELVDELWEPMNIRAWQGEAGAATIDPFYNYIPFQATSANLDDKPFSDDPAVADWVDDVQALTNVDLRAAAGEADLATACTGIGGQLVKPDEIQTQATNLASGLLAPLEAEIAGLKTNLASSEAARAAAEAARAAAQSAADAASARLAEVMPQLTPLSVTLGTSRATARRIARNGATASLTGPPLRSVKVQMMISQAQAKKLGLRSRVLASRTVTTGADGKAEALLKPNRRTARRLQTLRGNLTATVGAVSGDRTASTRAVITRR